MNKEDLAVAAHSEQGEPGNETEIAPLHKDNNDSSKGDKADKIGSDAEATLKVQYNRTMKPKPKPRKNIPKQIMKEDEDSDSHTPPPLPPRPKTGIDDHGYLSPPESNFDHYIGAAEFRPPSQLLEDDYQSQEVTPQQTDTDKALYMYQEQAGVEKYDCGPGEEVIEARPFRITSKKAFRRKTPPKAPQGTKVSTPPTRISSSLDEPTIRSDDYEDPYLTAKSIHVEEKRPVDQPNDNSEELYGDLPDPPTEKMTDNIQMRGTVTKTTESILLPERKNIRLPEPPPSTKSEELYDDLPDPPTQKMTDNIQIRGTVTKTTESILLPERKNIRLPKPPPSTKSPPAWPGTPESISAMKVKKYRPPTPDADQRPPYLDIDHDREIEHLDPNNDCSNEYQGLIADTPEVAQDKPFSNLLDEHAPITESKKSIFYLLKKASNFPGTNHWKALAQGLEKAKNPFMENNENNESLLTVSSRLGNLDVLKFLLKHGGDLNAHDKRMMYPIHTAAFYGHNPLVEHMLNNHINISMPGNKGITPLHYATINRKIATIEYLIRMGANVNARNHAGKKPYDYAKEGKHKDVLTLLEDAMIKNIGKSFEKTRQEAENKSVPKIVHEEISLVRQNIEHQAKKIDDLKKEQKREAQQVKKEIESIKDKAEEQDQKITRIETEYTEVRDTYHSQIMEQFEQMKRHQETMYEYTYMHNVMPPVGVPHSQSGAVLQKGLSNPEQEPLTHLRKSPIHQSQTCPDLTQKYGGSHTEAEYNQLDDMELVTIEVPNREKLSKDAKDKLQKNYAKIVRNAKIKRIDAELLSEFVIDFDTQIQWNSCNSDSEVAKQFLQILWDGTVEMCNKTKEILHANNQEDIADLLP